MARKVRHAFHDILEAIDRIEEVTRGKPLAEFEASWELRWLVQLYNEVGHCAHSVLLFTRQPEGAMPTRSGQLV